MPQAQEVQQSQAPVHRLPQELPPHLMPASMPQIALLKEPQPEVEVQHQLPTGAQAPRRAMQAQ